MLLYLVLLEVFQFALSSHYCYQCATNNAILNWSRYKLPTERGDSLAGDNDCFDDHTVSGYKSCQGVCVTVNITIGEGEYEKSIAVVRDCHRTPDNFEELSNHTTTNCITEKVEVRKRTYIKRSCYCTSDYCNGQSPRTHRRPSLRRPFPRPDANSGSAKTEVWKNWNDIWETIKQYLKSVASSLWKKLQQPRQQ